MRSEVPDLLGSCKWLLVFCLLLWCNAATWVRAEEGREMTQFKQDLSHCSVRNSLLGSREAKREAAAVSWVETEVAWTSVQWRCGKCFHSGFIVKSESED